MHKLGDETKAARRTAIIEAAGRITAELGWGEADYRTVALAVCSNRTSINKLFGNGDLERQIVAHAFELVLAATVLDGDPPQLNFSIHQHRMLSLFEGDATAPLLMAQVAPLRRHAMSKARLDQAFATELARAIDVLSSRTYSSSERVARLLDWYIGACAVFAAVPGIDLKRIEFLGQILGDQRR